MYETHLLMLFLVGVLASIGTYAGIGTVYAAPLNLIAWILLAMAVPSTTIALGDGTTTTVGAQAVGLTYMAYINAVGGLLPWMVTIWEWYQEEEDQVAGQTAQSVEEMLHGN